MESDSRSGNPRLLVLGAGPAQLGLLEAARRRGVWIGRRRPRPGRARLPLRRPPLHPLDRGRAGDRAARRRARDRRDHLAGHRLAGRRRGARSPSAPACRIRSRPRRRCSRRTSCASASGSPRPASRSRAGGSSAATTSRRRSAAPVVVKAPDRQGQKGLTLVEDPAELAGGDRDRARAPPATGSRSSRSSSTGRR